MRSSILVAVAAVLAFALGACFNPTFNNPACGPQDECPADHTCVQGVCRAMADPIDAPSQNDGADPDGPPPDGSPGDGPPSDGTQGCQLRFCSGQMYACGNCVDDDADGRIDSEDPECLGPCDQTEGAVLLMGVPNETGSCAVDVYWDNNTGTGNDDCRWNLQCYMQSTIPMCPFNSALLGSNMCPGQQSSTCVNVAAPLTPNGCDCFGCCFTPDQTRTVYLGGRNSSGNGTCTLAQMNDPLACPSCDMQPSCFNPCDNCEVCVGRPLVQGCGGLQNCPSGRARCGQTGQPECPSDEYCITGCCQPSPS